MEIQASERVLVTAKIENLADLYMSQSGSLSADQVRCVETSEALVDMDAPPLSMPKRLIAHLGLTPLRTRKARTCAGPVTLQVYGTVRLTIQGRDCPCDVIEVPDDGSVVIGQVSLFAMDWVVDPMTQRLIGDPRHGGEQIIELY